MKQFQKITDLQISSKGVASLSDRPNAMSQYGGEGLSPGALKQRFDKLASFIADKLNELYGALSGNDAAAYIHIALENLGVDSLDTLIKAMQNGSLANNILNVIPYDGAKDSKTLERCICDMAESIFVLEESETQRSEAEAERKNAESTRIADENGRVRAEAQRVSNENTRVEKENLRLESESNRSKNERARITLEERRTEKENLRVKAENERVESETERETAEKERVAAEILRRQHVESEDNPHKTTAEQIGLGNLTNDAQVKRAEMGKPLGVATLDENGFISADQIPGHLDDYAEYESLNDFPRPGASERLYYAKDTKLTYRWTGSDYGELPKGLGLGETKDTAYPGDKGKEAYEHAQSDHAPMDAEKNVIIGIRRNGQDITPDSDTRKANIDVPEKMSELENDENYLKKSDIPDDYLIGGEQTVISNESLGSNVFTFEKKDGTKETFIVKNGARGKSGVFCGSGDMPDDCIVQIIPDGHVYTLEQLKGEKGDDYVLTAEDKQEIIGNVYDRVLGESDAFGIPITEEAEGVFISINDSANRPIKKLIIKGTTQDGTMKLPSGSKIRIIGKNMFPTPYAFSHSITKGVEFTVNEDGTISVNGTATDDLTQSIINNLKPIFSSIDAETPLYISGCPIGGSGNGYSMVNMNTGHFILNKEDAVSSSAETNIGGFRPQHINRFGISVKKGTVCDNLLFKPMITVKQWDEPFEEYSANEITLPCDLNEGDTYFPIEGRVLRSDGSEELFEPVSGLSTFKGVTNVLQISDEATGRVHMEYTADTKLYIDNKFAEIQALILEG